MIKQFNFYDIYGYLLPGVVLLALFWLPIGIISRHWPEQDLSKALFLAVASYLAGHLIQTIAHAAIPSKVMRDHNDKRRFPSDRLLDEKCPDLGAAFKDRLSSQIKKQFGIELHIDQNGDGTGTIAADRSAAFFQARSYLLAKKTAHYVEQFEGLYAMMRGLSLVFAIGFFYLLGWSLVFYQEHAWLQVALCILLILGAVGGVVAALFSFAKPKIQTPVRWLAGALLLVSLGMGFELGTLQSSSFPAAASPGSRLLLWFFTACAFVASERCYSSYQSFAIQFAQSVWRDFSVHLGISADQDSKIGATAESEED